MKRCLGLKWLIHLYVHVNVISSLFSFNIVVMLVVYLIRILVANVSNS